jgi:DNA replication and repair protein RecF
LSQKNALLKGDSFPDRLLLESYNERLIHSGKIIFNSRQHFVTAYLSVLINYYEQIAGSVEKVSLTYQSQFDCDDVKEMYIKMLEKEILYKRPLIGIHKDDYNFIINDKELKKYGSQGQIKSFLYALRVAEFLYLKEHLNMKPILILDDFFEKLDKQRLTQLINLINNDTFDQVFLSDTELERSQKIFDENKISFTAHRIDNGHICNQKSI